MSCAEILLKSDPAHCRRHEHLTARVHVLAVRKRSRQSFRDQMNPFQGDAIAKRLKNRRSKRFDAVRERVQTGGSSKFRRQIHGDFRIEDDQLGQKPG